MVLHREDHTSHTHKYIDILRTNIFSKNLGFKVNTFLQK